MRHLLTTVVVIATTTVLTWTLAANMRPFPAAISQPAQAPENIAHFAQAMCARNADGVIMGLDPSILLSEDALRQSVAALDPCSSVRYLGHLVNVHGATEYVFVLTYAKGEAWWVFTMNPDGTKVVSAQ